MGSISQKAPDSEESHIDRDTTTRTLFYQISAVNQQDADYSLWSQSPPYYQGLPKQSFRATAALVGQYWVGEVSYSWPQRHQEVGTCWVEFDTTGGRTKMTQSLETLHSYVSPSSK